MWAKYEEFKNSRLSTDSRKLQTLALKILPKTLTSWAQREKTLQEKVTFTDSKKIA